MRSTLALLTFTTALSAATLPSLAQDAAATPDGAAPAKPVEKVGAGTFAEPSIVNPSWSLDVRMGVPRAIQIQTGPKPGWYFYLPYKVINNTGEDRLFIPQFTVVTDAGEVIQAGRRIPTNVYPEVANQLGNSLVESPDDVMGTLLQGADFAKESVAIWPIPTSDVDQFTVFLTGADGETVELRSPSTGEVVMQAATDPISGQPVLDENQQPVMRPVMLQRTRVYTYSTPGTIYRVGTPQDEPVKLIASYEVMR